jgi:tRNA threonylcarbamoyladenosine biosynthesis protein TsaB
MRVLAIDTALAACSAALFDSDRSELIASESQPMLRGHAEALVPMISRVMAAAGLRFSDLDRVAVTVGPGSFTGLRVGVAGGGGGGRAAPPPPPGSFTGLRVGVAAARGLALAAAIPAVSLSTFSAYAAPHMAEDDSTPLLAAIDARNEQVYMQLFGPGGRTISAPRVASLRDALRTASAGPARLAGSGAAAIAALWPADQAPPTLVDNAAFPDIAWVAQLGAAAPEATEPPKPFYLSPPSAKPQAGALGRA